MFALGRRRLALVEKRFAPPTALKDIIAIGKWHRVRITFGGQPFAHSPFGPLRERVWGEGRREEWLIEDEVFAVLLSAIRNPQWPRGLLNCLSHLSDLPAGAPKGYDWQYEVAKNHYSIRAGFRAGVVHVGAHGIG